MGHIHADLMAQYAEDAKHHDKPWELWQFNYGDTWAGCSTHPRWVSDFTYRRKPRTVLVGDIEVPELARLSWSMGRSISCLTLQQGWAAAAPGRTTLKMRALASNLVHLDIQSAALHAKALIEVSKGWWK